MSRTWRVQDLTGGLVVFLGSVVLGAPVGLLWSAVSPRVRVTVTERGPAIADLETNKGFIGADGSYVLVMLGAGLLCGVLAWQLFRRCGPTTVVALFLGGLVAAFIAARVGVMPHATEAIDAVTEGSQFRGDLDLYLGRHHGSGDSANSLWLRATWAGVAWPAAALIAFMTMATIRPEGLE